MHILLTGATTLTYTDDFCEEEFSEESALQRDSDPSLNEVTLLKALSLDPLEEVFMPNSLAELPGCQLEELIDSDQGVALDSADIRPVESYSDISTTFDLPFSSPTMTAPSVVSEPLCSPYQLTSPGFAPAQSFTYPHDLSLPAVPHTMPEHFVGGLEAIQVNSVLHSNDGLITGRQNSELDLICSVIEDVGHTVGSADHAHAQGAGISVSSTKLLNQLVSSGDMDSLWLPSDNYTLPLPPTSSRLSSCLTDTPLKNVSSTPSLTVRVDFCERAPSIPIGALHVNESRGSQTESGSTCQSSPFAQSTCSPVTTANGSNDHDSVSSLPPSPLSSTGNEHSSLVDMPFYQFKKIIDSPHFSERDKEQVKVIRKRGKNKVAAKSCRQRKLELITSLQQEVDRLKEVKSRLALRELTLQREIEQYKSQCSQSTTSTLRAPLCS